jgi:hypothetical protein
MGEAQRPLVAYQTSYSAAPSSQSALGTPRGRASRHTYGNLNVRRSVSQAEKPAPARITLNQGTKKSMAAMSATLLERYSRCKSKLAGAANRQNFVDRVPGVRNDVWSAVEVPGCDNLRAR